MSKKTFNIGECSYYGRWKIEVNKNNIVVTGMDWDTREVRQTDTFAIEAAHDFTLENHLTDISTAYWASTMLEWVKKHVPEKETTHGW